MRGCFHGLTLSFLLFPLVGCQENRNDMWYMQHPVALKQALTTCQSAKGQDQCERLMSVAENLQTIIMDQQTHPEEFGQRIMEAEQQAVNLREAVNQAETKLQALELARASTVEIRSAKDDLYKAKKSSHDQQQQIKIMLGVVALSSPE